MLQSPYFLYRAEVGRRRTARPTAELSPFELASRLSYLLWGSMPDDTLMAAPPANQLGSKDAIARQAQRMLDDPRARAMVASFDEQWLHTYKLSSIQKDAATYPDFTPADGQRDEDRDRHVRRRRGVAKRRQHDGPVHRAVHVPEQGAVGLLRRRGGATGNAFARVELDPTRAAGLLTQGGMMAAIAHATETDPTRRGKFVRVQLLCESIPPPPPNVMATADQPRPGPDAPASAPRISAAAAAAARATSLMDRIGFGVRELRRRRPLARSTKTASPSTRPARSSAPTCPGAFDGAAAAGAEAGGERRAPPLRSDPVVAVRVRARRGEPPTRARSSASTGVRRLGQPRARSLAGDDRRARSASRTGGGATMKPLSRRTLLRGIGGTAIALPWLEAMEGRERMPSRHGAAAPDHFRLLANGTPVRSLRAHDRRVRQHHRDDQHAGAARAVQEQAAWCWAAST